MTSTDYRSKYPKFIYNSFSHRTENDKLICEFKYSIPPTHSFSHTVTFEHLSAAETPRGWPNGLPRGGVLDTLVFHLGLAELFSYWKLTCSPVIEVRAGRLAMSEVEWWHKLLIHGMGQYFYENRIDFTDQNFITINVRRRVVDLSAQEVEPLIRRGSTSEVLVPLGGGKDSIVTAELLKEKFTIRPIIVYPTTPASRRISHLLTTNPPIIVYRTLDPLMLQLSKTGYLTGHIPYSAVLAFIFLLAAEVECIPDIAVSNEASSDEGNVDYLGHTINHQYSKSLEFESDLKSYIVNLKSSVKYFSFLRPLHELQIAKLFSQMPRYFKDFRSCNKNQRQDSWCGRCPKCLSIALSLMPWVGEAQIVEIIGTNPLTDPSNHEQLAQMTDPAKVKPFECIVSTDEAQVCLEFIAHGRTARVSAFLDHFGPTPNTPPQFIDILKAEYYKT